VIRAWFNVGALLILAPILLVVSVPFALWQMSGAVVRFVSVEARRELIMGQLRSRS
jgi:hypothetical protein